MIPSFDRCKLNDEDRERLLFEIEERAAIKEFDGGLDRETAEREARRETVQKWVDDYVLEHKGNPLFPDFQLIDEDYIIRKAKERRVKPGRKI